LIEAVIEDKNVTIEEAEEHLKSLSELRMQSDISDVVDYNFTF
jgi:hypothetical protein